MNRYLERIHPFVWIVLAGLSVWGLTISFGFVWDDFPMIANNASLHQWKTLLAGWFYDFWGLHDVPQASGYWRPTATMVHVVLTQLTDGHPWVFHLTNVLLHIGTTILFYAFLKNTKLIQWVWIPVLFFLCHPLAAEAVSFNSASPDLLSAFFGWFAVVLWTKRKDQVQHRIPAFIFLALSYTSKESGVFFGFFMIGYDLLINRENFNKKRMWNDGVIMVLTFVYVLCHKIVIHGLGVRDRLWGGDLEHHLATVCKLFIYQMMLMIFPMGSSPVRDFEIVNFSSPWAWMGASIFFIFVGLFVYFRKQKPIIAFTIFFYLVFWFPISNIIPAEGLIVDRYMYVLIMAAGFVIVSVLPNFEKFPKLIGMILLGYAIWAVNSSLSWKSSETLWKHATKASPKSSVAWNEWGNVMSSQQKYQDAYDAYDRAVQLQPQYRDAAYNRIYSLYEMKDPQTKKMIDQHLRNFPEDAQAMDLMGTVYESEGNFEDAIDYSLKAVSTASTNWKYRYNLAEVFIRMKKYEEAIEELKTAADLSRGNFDIVKSLAGAYCMNGQYQPCVDTYVLLAQKFPERAGEIEDPLGKSKQLLELTKSK